MEFTRALTHDGDSKFDTKLRAVFLGLIWEDVPLTGYKSLFTCYLCEENIFISSRA